jgi:hypothetical protein
MIIIHSQIFNGIFRHRHMSMSSCSVNDSLEVIRRCEFIWEKYNNPDLEIKLILFISAWWKKFSAWFRVYRTLKLLFCVSGLKFFVCFVRTYAKNVKKFLFIVSKNFSIQGLSCEKSIYKNNFLLSLAGLIWKWLFQNSNFTWISKTR